MRLADFITAHMEEILQKWQEYAQTIKVAEEMDQKGLRNHAKQMLEAIVKDLVLPQTLEDQIKKSEGKNDLIGANGEDGKMTASWSHGNTRFDSGFLIEDLIAEYRALRASVLRLWGKDAVVTQQSDLDDMTRFNEAIDQALARSVLTYVTKKNSQIHLFETMISSSLDHHCIMDLKGRLIYANASMADRFHIPPHEMVGKTLFNLDVAAATELCPPIEQISNTKKPIRGEISYGGGDSAGKKQYYDYIFAPIVDDQGHVEVVIGSARDISERKRWDEQIWHHANYDVLTDLPNRRLFRDRLNQELKHAERTEMSVALLFIDLDRFKEANDMLGHEAGDLLLRQAAERIRSCIREKDTVARLGGDEFTVILSDIEKLDSVQSVANKILKELANPFIVLQEIVQISASIGIIDPALINLN